MFAGIVALPLSTSLSRNAFKFFQFSLLPVGLGQELTQLCAQSAGAVQICCALCRLIRKVCLAGRKLVLPDRQSVFVNFVRCVVSAPDRSRIGVTALAGPLGQLVPRAWLQTCKLSNSS